MSDYLIVRSDSVSASPRLAEEGVSWDSSVSSVFKQGQSILQTVQDSHPLKGRVSLFCSKYVTPFASLWGAARNAVGLTIAILTVLSMFGVIAFPQVFIALSIIYALFILVQGLLAGGPTCIGGIMGAIREYKIAKALNDDDHKRTALLKGVNAFLSLLESGFWITIAIFSLTGFGAIANLVTIALYFVFFNITFIYMTALSSRDLVRHKSFHNKIDLNDPYKTLNNLTTWQAKDPTTIARELNRFEEQTNAKCRENLEAWLQQPYTSIKETKALAQEIRKANLQKMIADGITIALGIIGLLFSLDFLIANFNQNVSDIVDWAAWILLNLAFLLFLDEENLSDKLLSLPVKATCKIQDLIK